MTHPHPLHNTSRGFLVILLIAALALFAAVSVRQQFAMKNQLMTLTDRMNQLFGAGPQESKAQEVVAKIGKLMMLPSDTRATVAAITNAEQLKKENYAYRNAHDGDYILLTETRAILYRPSEDRIVDVLPVTQQGASSLSPRNN